MKLIINTTVLPYFCCFYDEKNKNFFTEKWENNKKSAEIIWKFLGQNLDKIKNLQYIGGVSGPGGFSNVRICSIVINAINFTYKTPILSISGDKWIEYFLKKNKYLENFFLLNSFGDNVFFKNEKKELEFLDIKIIAKKFGNQPMWVYALPEKKQKFFTKKIFIPEKQVQNSLFEALEKTKPIKNFAPYYGVHPVN